MYIVAVRIEVLPDKVDAFLEEMLKNARGARTEPGNLRFDVLRAIDPPNHFLLYEVYKDEQAFQEHQKTQHYLAWKERVVAYLAQPRTSVKYRNVFPEPWA
jgi:autoinducer 2-degrading protein